MVSRFVLADTGCLAREAQHLRTRPQYWQAGVKLNELIDNATAREQSFSQGAIRIRPKNITLQGTTSRFRRSGDGTF